MPKYSSLHQAISSPLHLHLWIIFHWTVTTAFAPACKCTFAFVSYKNSGGFDNYIYLKILQNISSDHFSDTFLSIYNKIGPLVCDVLCFHLPYAVSYFRDKPYWRYRRDRDCDNFCSGLPSHLQKALPMTIFIATRIFHKIIANMLLCSMTSERTHNLCTCTRIRTIPARWAFKSGNYGKIAKPVCRTQHRPWQHVGREFYKM